MKCPICLNSEKFKSVKKHIDENYDYAMIRCLVCDSYFADPLKEVGFDWYENRYEERNYPWRWEFGVLIGYLKKIASDKKNGDFSLIDVGCGNGRLLKKIRFLYKQSYLVGLDFNRWAIADLKNCQILSYAKKLEEFVDSGDRKFDFIVFFHLFEHIDNPNEFLDRIRLFLKPGGQIIFSVPNLDRWNLQFWGFEEKDSPPHHLLRFSKAGLSELLNRHGFKINIANNEPLRFTDVWSMLYWQLLDSWRFGVIKKINSDLRKKNDARGTDLNIRPARSLRHIISQNLVLFKKIIIGFISLPYSLAFYLLNRRRIKGRPGHTLMIFAAKTE